MKKLAWFFLTTLILDSRALSQNYAVSDLGTLGGSASQTYAINNRALIVGSSVTADGGSHAFLFSNGSMTDLGIRSSLSVATAVNASNQLAGYYYNGDYNAFVWTKGKVHDLGNLGLKYSVAYAINGLGHACGSSKVKEGLYGAEHAFLWTGGKMTDLGTLGGKDSSARGVNGSDQVVGYAYLASGTFHAFLRTGGTMFDLGTLGGDYSYAYAINDAGQIVGAAALPDNTRTHAFFSNGSGPFQDLGDLGYNVSEALALNSTGTLVVGRATVPSNTGYTLYHAFAWNGGVMRDLNGLIPANSDWILNEATGVNDAGVIVGNGTFGGQTRAFRLTPR